MPDFDALRSVFTAAPANRHLGSNLVEAADGRACVAMTAKPELVQENGVIHGGYLSTLADTAAVYAVVSKLEEGFRPTGVEFKINFMRPGRPGAGDIEARAGVVQRGRTLAIVDVEVFQGDALIAKALFTYMITAPQG